MPQSPTLFTIPVELQKDILDLLPYPTLQVLHVTHPHFQTLIDFQQMQASKSHESIVDELIIAARFDTFLATKPRFACRDCLRLLRNDHFADKQRKYPLHLWFCIKCGLKTRYQPGARITCMGTPGVYCWDCKKVRQGQAKVNAEKPHPFCADCVPRQGIKRLKEQKRQERSVRRQRRYKRAQCLSHSFRRHRRGETD